MLTVLSLKKEKGATHPPPEVYLQRDRKACGLKTGTPNLPYSPEIEKGKKEEETTRKKKK